jgi:DNA-binding response OmpR family regulator
MKQTKILIIDDEREISELIQLYLKREGYVEINSFDLIHLRTTGNGNNP